MKLPKIGILDRFILGQLVPPFFFGIMAFSVILIAGTLLFQIAELLIERNVSLGVVIRLFFYSLPGIMVMTIPMSCLLSALLGFAGMSANSELVALKATGISFQRIVRPVLLLSVFISIGALLMNETLVPMTQTAASNLLRYEVFQNTPPLLKERIFLKEENASGLKRVIYIGSIAPKTGEMKDILIQEFENESIRRIVSAVGGQWADGQWWLNDGQVFDVQKNGAVQPLFRFKRERLDLNMTPDKVGKSSTKPDQMSIRQLKEEIETLEMQGAESKKLRMVLHLRLAVPWASVVLALVGATLGSRPQRSSSGMGLGLSVIIVFVYYVILSVCKSLGESGFLPILVAAWMPNALFLSLGGYLSRRANQLG